MEAIEGYSQRDCSGSMNPAQVCHVMHKSWSICFRTETTAATAAAWWRGLGRRTWAYIDLDPWPDALQAKLWTHERGLHACGLWSVCSSISKLQIHYTLSTVVWNLLASILHNDPPNWVWYSGGKKIQRVMPREKNDTSKWMPDCITLWVPALPVNPSKTLTSENGKPVPVCVGTGFARCRCGRPKKTPGRPVKNPMSLMTLRL